MRPKLVAGVRGVLSADVSAPYILDMTPARIKLYRSGSWLEAGKLYRVWIDSRPVGGLASNGSLTVEVAPGPHTVRARGRWLRGCEETVRIGNGECKWIQLVAMSFDLRGLVNPHRGLSLVVE